jgi:hypothetical protein
VNLDDIRKGTEDQEVVSRQLLNTAITYGTSRNKALHIFYIKLKPESNNKNIYKLIFSMQSKI